MAEGELPQVHDALQGGEGVRGWLPEGRLSFNVGFMTGGQERRGITGCLEKEVEWK